MIKREIKLIVEDYFEDDDGNPETEEEFIRTMRINFDEDIISEARIVEFSAKIID